MTADIVERVRRSSRYRDVDPTLIARLAGEELPRSRNADEAVKRVKRRLHQAVGAFTSGARRDPLAAVRETWMGDLAEPGFRAACENVLLEHASTRERVPYLDAFYAGIRDVTGAPARLLDLGCGLAPLALPWMDLPKDATYHAVDVDRRGLETVGAFLAMVGQRHLVEARDLVTELPTAAGDVALLLKVVTTLDRQDPAAADRVLAALDVRHAVVSFPRRSLGGRGKGMERSYRERLDRLLAASPRVEEVTETSVPSELAFVLRLSPVPSGG